VAPHNVLDDLKAPSNDMTKNDHALIVEGPGNSLDRDQNYEIEEDLNSIPNTSINLKVAFVGLLERHDIPR
jgi:hypothetical protein